MENFNLTSLIVDEKSSLPEEIAKNIVKQIILGKLNPGSRLIESNIAKELDVSNIPVREAFYILQNTGVIERLPRKGVRVKSISDQEMNDYTDALIELFKIGVEYSKAKWTKEKREQLIQYLKEAEEKLTENNVLEYVVKVAQLCQYVFEVAENIAFVKFYSDITFITNVYSQMKWVDVEQTKDRNNYLEEMVDALVHSNFEKAKESFDLLTRKALNIK